MSEEFTTVAEAIGDEPRVDAVDAVDMIDPPRHPHQPAFPDEGIYFGMPEDVYHSIHACSSSGLKKLSVSSMDYWATSLLNQEREEEAEKDSGKLTPKQLGHAYHSYIVEGPAVFDQRFAVALDKDEVRGKAAKIGRKLCVTIADIREAIDALGIKPKGTSKDALCDQLLEEDSLAFIWDRMVAAHNDANKGKTMISAKLHRRIAIAHAMITNDPQLKDAFTGGHAEVSIFWRCKTTGAPMKARLDYIKMMALVDLKSFSNMQGKPVQRAIDMAISNNKYFIPVVVYLEAIAAAKGMMKAAPKHRHPVFEGSFNKDGEWCARLAVPALIEWCWKWAHQPEPQVLFIFQQTGIAPVTRGRIMPTATTYMINNSAVQFLKKKWVRCAKAYGEGPWVDFEPVVQTEDESLTWSATDFGDVE
jgi:hypothetical protein